MNDPVSVTFTYGRNEYVRAIKHHYFRTLQLRRDIVASVLGVLIGAYLTFVVRIGWIGWLVMAVGIILLAMINYAVFLLPLLIYQSQPKLKDEYRLSFHDSGIDFKTAQIDSKLQWSLYRTWWSDPDFFILYYGKRDLTVIPRRVLNGSEDKQLQDLLMRHLGQPKS